MTPRSPVGGPAPDDKVREFTRADYIRDPSPATQAALDGFRVVVLDTSGKPSLTFCGQPGHEERVFEGVVSWERNVPHPELRVSADPAISNVDTMEMLRDLVGQRVRVTIEVLPEPPTDDRASSEGEERK